MVTSLSRAVGSVVMPALWPSLLAAALLLPPAFAAAQTPVPLPPETRLVGVTGAPAATEDDFSIATAQDLVVTLTDLQVPFALSSATVVITQAGSIVGNATLAPPATSATVAIPGANGQYALRVFGMPNAAYSVGTFTVCVAPKANPSSCIQSASIAGNISAPSAAGDPTVSTLTVNFPVTTAGAYTVTFADDQFPVALNSAPNLALFQGGTPVQLGIPSGTVLNLSASTYTLLAIAQADQTIQAGLYGITISGPSGVAPVLSDTYPVGILGPPQIVLNPSSQTLTLKISDFAFPAALAGASAIATSGGTKLGVASIVNASSFPASAGTLQYWSFATAGTDAGTYEVDLTSPTAALRQSTSGVNKGNSLAFAFLTPVLPSGSYQENASDFQFPQTLQGLQFAVAQNGSILAKSAAPGSLNFTAAAGPVVLLADATTPANGNGLFDVNVQTSGASPQLVFDKTQGVSASGLFDSQTINLGTPSADFDVTLTDLNFPTPFQDLALVVSNGGAVLGKIFGGGTFPISATPGAYQLTFIATPAAKQQYGMYAVQIVYAAPTVTLSASPTSVAAGGLTTLSWTTKDATSCTASGGAWGGNPSTGSGTLAVIVSATTTFTVTCTGPGGTGAQSVVVTATARPGSSGGGGDIDPSLLILLGMIATVRARYRS